MENNLYFIPIRPELAGLKIGKLFWCDAFSGKLKENIEDSFDRAFEFKYKNHSHKIEYNYKFVEDNDEKNNEENMELSDNDSLTFSQEIVIGITNRRFNIKNIEKFPYSSIGILSVKFPKTEEIYNYTCFLIYSDIVVTLSSNLYKPKEGGRAISIKTSFSEKEVKWNNIYLEENFEIKNENKNEEKDINNYSKLAVILYEDNVSKEWIGIEAEKKENHAGRDLYSTFYPGFKNLEDKKILREVYVSTKTNPFKEYQEDEDKKEIEEILKHCPGSPIYYKGYDSGCYVVAIINEFYDIQYFNNKSFTFLFYMIKEANLRKKNASYLINLDFSEMKLYPKDIKKLIEVDFGNLRILDLSFNFIGPKGSLYLSAGKFSSLEILNLDCNKIGDEGLRHISNGFFWRLSYLYLSNNFISSEGIKHLVRAEFINNVIELTLDDNIKIGDNGIKIIKEHKGWNKIKVLSLNKTGLTDISLGYFGESSMPKLKDLIIKGNNFSDQGKAMIFTLRLNHIHVSYRDSNVEDIALIDDDEGDELIDDESIKYLYATQKKEKKNKSQKKQIKDNYIITQNYNDNNNDNSNSLSKFNQLNKYLNF